MEWEKYSHHISDKMLMFKIYEVFTKLNSNNNKKSVPSKHGQKNRTNMSDSKKIFRWLTSIWNFIYHHWSSDSCRSKWPWVVISHQWEWPVYKRPEMTSTSGDVMINKFSFIIYRLTSASASMENVETSQNIKTKLPHELVITLLGIYLPNIYIS